MTGEIRSIEMTPLACPALQSAEGWAWLEMKSGSGLVKFDAMCRAIAVAKSVDEIKKIHDTASAMAVAARVAKNKDTAADCEVIRLRAVRRLDQMRQAQKETVGLAKGGGGKHGRKRVIEKPTLESQGIDKNLANQGRVLGKLSDKQFEQTLVDTRDAITRAVRGVVRMHDIAQQREDYTGRVEHGGTVADLEALAASGYRAGVIYADAPWQFRTYSGKGKQRSAERYYDVMTLDEIKALPVAQLAAKDCALFLWGVCPELPGALDVMRAWGFEYSTVAFAWVKQNRSGDGLFTGMGYHTRSNIELCLLGLRGTPTRLAKDVHQVVMSPVGEHSVKPTEVRERIERLYPGPYLELFSRRDDIKGWKTWGNEVPKKRAGR